MACVRSGISGWAIGLLIRGRAGAERRAANPGRRVLADVEARRRFLFGTWRSGGGGALRQQPLATAGRGQAFGCARTLLDFGIGRARPLLELLGKGPRSTFAPVSSCARGRRLGQRFRSGGAGAQLWGLFGASRSKPLAEGSVACVRSGISGWAIGLLIRGRAGAERRAANPGRRVLADVEARRRFLFGT